MEGRRRLYQDRVIVGLLFRGSQSAARKGSSLTDPVSGKGNISLLQTCRLCGADLTHTFVDLGMSPLCESYVAAGQLDGPESLYPLHVRLCAACLLVQIPASVSGEHIF